MNPDMPFAGMLKKLSKSNMSLEFGSAMDEHNTDTTLLRSKQHMYQKNF